MGTPREQIESEWNSLRKRLNANFRSREIGKKKSEAKKEEKLSNAQNIRENFLSEYEENNELLSDHGTNQSDQNAESNDDTENEMFVN